MLHWLRWAEGEYALQPTREHGFDMNGRALCILTKDDFRLRAPGSGQGNSLVSPWSVLMDTRLVQGERWGVSWGGSCSPPSTADALLCTDVCPVVPS